MSMNKKTQLQKKLGEKRRLEAKKEAKKSSSLKVQYRRYLEEREKQRARGWVMKEGSVEDFAFDEFEAHISTVKNILENERDISPDMLTAGYLTDLTLEDQLATNNDSIAQACKLWNEHENLVANFGRMTPGRFRANEVANFITLKNEYPSKGAFDEAMSY